MNLQYTRISDHCDRVLDQTSSCIYLHIQTRYNLYTHDNMLQSLDVVLTHSTDVIVIIGLLG